MNEQIKQIAARLKGLREVLDLTTDEVAAVCGIGTEEYMRLESGEVDIPVSVLYQISTRYKIDLSALMFGEEPHMESYFLTRKGKGVSVQRTQAYQYQSLAAGFMHRKADPFIVTVEPHKEDTPIFLNMHSGQEFNYVLKGRMLLQLGSKALILNEGDSLFFDSTRPHGMKALDGESVQFLAIIF
ncbi:MAG: cupin domain-containing protein [Porphyromonadaceae bacterium]|nr:cupin domain-containing protein [Porphyromonadaceae bacterium]MCD8287263.1 cupin domain-containing protein [Porphyromonadaceae bacterium]